jgi:hypothetical protein
MFYGVVAKLRQTLMVAPIFTIVDDIIIKILIQYFIHFSCSTIDLQMEGSAKFLLCTHLLH